MAISARVDNYLKQHHVDFAVIYHRHSEGAYDTAVAAHIPMKKLAKAVLLADHDDKHLLAVLPASNLLNLKNLSKSLQRELRFVPEQDLEVYFSDCSTGAIPAIGQAYNLPLIWDESLLEQEDIYLEGGDHEVLLHLGRSEFMKLMADQPHMIISKQGSAHLKETGVH